MVAVGAAAARRGGVVADWEGVGRGGDDKGDVVGIMVASWVELLVGIVLVGCMEVAEAVAVMDAIGVSGEDMLVAGSSKGSPWSLRIESEILAVIHAITRLKLELKNIQILEDKALAEERARNRWSKRAFSSVFEKLEKALTETCECDFQGKGIIEGGR